MDGQNYVVFHTAADDSYMNSSANFRGADVTSNTEITVSSTATIDETAETGKDANLYLPHHLQL